MGFKVYQKLVTDFTDVTAAFQNTSKYHNVVTISPGDPTIYSNFRVALMLARAAKTVAKVFVMVMPSEIATALDVPAGFWSTTGFYDKYKQYIWTQQSVTFGSTTAGHDYVNMELNCPGSRKLLTTDVIKLAIFYYDNENTNTAARACGLVEYDFLIENQ